MKLQKIFSKLYQKRLRLFKNCNELPLKNFLNVMATGEFKYLYDVTDHGKLKEVGSKSMSMLWGDIILEYGQLDRNMQIADSFDSQKIIYQLEASYITIKSMIRILMFVTPQTKNKRGRELAVETIDGLKKLGYKIDVSSSKFYASSIHSADKRCNSIITQIKIRKSEMNQGETQDNMPVSFDNIISSLNTALKFVVPDDITVARYCAYKKNLNEKYKNVS